MCEFKVYLGGNLVAEDVVKAALSSGALKLRDVIGREVEVEGAVIASLDVTKEAMEVRKLPLAGPLLKFLEAYEECASGAGDLGALRAAWEELKAKGDRLLAELAKARASR